jgi:hypothetical protein
VIHLIDRVVQYPLGLTETLDSANLTEYKEMLIKSGMIEKIKEMQGVTLLVRTREGPAAEEGTRESVASRPAST